MKKSTRQNKRAHNIAHKLYTSSGGIANMVRLSQKAQVTLFGICVAGLIFGGAGYAQAKSVEAKYEEQTKQLELYKQELDEAQSLIQENTSYKAKYECIQIEKQQLEKQVEELSK